ncbi:MAG: adenosine deaminase [Bryobacteraceae bacterium]|nr:adenosine deaminase [Bryobacteraceae bacterium]
MLEFIQALPKAELHVHLEGSIEPETLRRIDPSLSIGEIREHYGYTDFGGFLKSFAWVARRLKGPREYAIAASGLLEGLAQQNVRYAEITLSAGVALWMGLDLGAIHEALNRAAAGSKVEAWWIWDVTRQWGPVPAYDVLEMAVERRGEGVVGFGIGGDEARGPAGWYRDIFERAKDKGLRLVCHAGETAGPESVEGALAIGAERIGHGIACHQDPALMARLAESDIPVEISISSNVRTGAVSALGEHPVRRIFDAGVAVILNTDDPPMFGTTLNGEYLLAANEFGFTKEELRRLAENSFRYAFRWNRPFPG